MDRDKYIEHVTNDKDYRRSEMRSCDNQMFFILTGGALIFTVYLYTDQVSITYDDVKNILGLLFLAIFFGCVAVMKSPLSMFKSIGSMYIRGAKNILRL